ncbi:MAG: YajQ family cyclic di-GMP-binding protein [Deltaproteobacteria bacterium]|nr:YajQ family cyclic di-GMP-binding protein [Deltaproteobacteria bacterium]
MPSFDVVSKLEMHEVENAVQQAKKEVQQRYDFRGAKADIEKNQDGIVITANAEGRVDAAYTVLQEKLVRRKVSLKSLDAQANEAAGGGTYRLLVKLKEGVEKDKAKEIVKFIKDSKLKVQASIQGDTVRVTGKKRDDLQQTIAALKASDIDLPMQYINFRD